MKKNLQHLASFLVLGIFVFIAFGSGDDEKDTDSSTTTEATTTTTEEPTAAEPEKPKSNWAYTENEDKMDGSKNYFASTISTNEVNFEFPYEGGSFFTLIIRNAKGVNEVIMRVSEGQFISSFGASENVRVKFDEEAPVTYSFSSPDDGSADVIFINSSNSFIQKLKGAEKLMIEAPFYDAGRQIAYFDVKGLEWDK